MRVLFAAGGTGGHINPALAIAGTIKERHSDAEILFAGTPWGMEAKFVPDAGYDFTPIKVRGIERSLSFKAIKSNFKTLRYLITANSRAKKIIREFSPDVVIGTGGYVSGPVVRAAAKMGIKTLIHEQNAYPGVTTKLLARDVDVILVAFKEAMSRINTRAKMLEVGNPVRQEFLFAKKDECRKKLGLDPDKTVILSCGGSLGAKAINTAIMDVLKWHYKKRKIQHIHATGHFGSLWMPDELRKSGIDIDNDPDIRVMEYISNMPEYLAACDLIITRSGAITLSEIEAQGKAAVLIPSPNVTENHQFHNAMVLANAGAGVVIEEKDLSGKKLIKTIEELTSDSARLKEMGKNAAAISKTDANNLIYDEVMRLYR
ncbi:MAG: undecaprenyldiphospho-muramoylpentapeptide beta-N-acetylglucosaminyltransferase, partial [Oscillospiraceae bacterium]|nr:undecaprenyldiphospho-muramoylpentapeptide beta-N-acetylglucosaminyltransferase [Oscillospiraceae bacterium]